MPSNIHQVSQTTVLVNGQQAEAEIKKLETTAKRFARSKRQAFEDNDLSAYRKWDTELRNISKTIRTLRAETISAENVLKNINGASFEEVRIAAAKANLELKRTRQTDPGYQTKAKQAELLNSKLREMSNTMRGIMPEQKSMMRSISVFFNQYFTTITGFIMMFSGMAYAFKSWTDGLAKMDDQMANVRKTTGLTMKEVRELGREFNYLNTRTSKMELFKLAEEGGRLGIKNKKDLMGFVEVGNMIAVALGDDLKGNAEEAIKVVGKMANTYRIGTRYGVGFKDAMLMIGSSINEVSANSQAQAPFLIDMLKRMAGISDQSGITAQQVIGYASALDQLGQSAEISGTALNKTILNMFTDTATYAGIAGMEVKDFRKLLQTDANKALLTFLEGLNSNNQGLLIMAQKFDGLGLDGARAIQVLAALSGNTKLVAKEQALANKALEEASSLTDEYSIKNNNLAGNMEKISRKMHALFINSQLNKALSEIVATMAAWVEIPLREKLEAEGQQVSRLTGLLTNADTKLNDRVKILEELKRISPEIVEGLKAENLQYGKLKTNLEQYNEQLAQRIVLADYEAERAALREKAAKQRANALKMEAEIYQLIGSFNPASLINFDSTEKKLEDAIRFLESKGASVKMLFKGLQTTPYGSTIDNRSKEQKLLDRLVSMESYRLKFLKEEQEIMADISPINERIKAFKELLKSKKELDGPVNAQNEPDPLDLEETLKAAKLRNDSEKLLIQSRIALLKEGYEKELAQLRQSHAEKRQAIESDLKFNAELTKKDKANLQQTLLNMKKLLKIEEEKLEKEFRNRSLELDKQLIDLELAAIQQGSAEELQLKVQQLEKQQELELSQIAEHEERKELLRRGIIRKYDKMKADLMHASLMEQLGKAFLIENTRLIKDQETLLAALNARRLSGKTNEERYRLELQQLQEAFSRKSLLLAVNKAEKELEILKAAGHDVLEAEKELARLRLELQSSAVPGKQISKQEVFFKDYAEAALDAARQMSDAVFQIQANNWQRELELKIALLNRQREHELKNSRLTEAQKEAIRENYQRKEAALRKKAWKREKDAAIIQAVINGALAITKTFAHYGFTPAAWLAVGAQAVATASQVAVIAAQKPPLFQKGGYTRKDVSNSRIAGLVHANEFVANAAAVDNPSVRPVLDIIDQAQRNGQISQLNLPELIAGPSGPKGHHNSRPQPPIPYGLQESYAPLRELQDSMNKLNLLLDKLDKEGLQARLVYMDFKKMQHQEELLRKLSR